jgi:homospermidine synthase
MRGNKITNVYIIDGKELNSKELTNDQLLLIETNVNRGLYNDFRNKLLEEKGDDIFCTIRIRIPEMELEAIDEYGIKIL